jgi:hypothetical protein
LKFLGAIYTYHYVPINPPPVGPKKVHQVVVVAGALDVVVASVVVTDAVVVMVEAVEVDVAVKDEVVVDGLRGHVGSDTTTLIC